MEHGNLRVSDRNPRHMLVGWGDFCSLSMTPFQDIVKGLNSRRFIEEREMAFLGAVANILSIVSCRKGGGA